MSYIPPSGSAAVFDFAGEPYTPPPGSAVDFELAADDGGPGIVYPIPPAIMVTSALSVQLAGGTRSARAGITYRATAARRDIRRALSAGMASRQIDRRAPQTWDRVQARDERLSEGIQPWGAAQTKDGRENRSGWDAVARKDDNGAGQSWDDSIRPVDGGASHGYHQPPARDLDNEHRHADSAKWWEPEATQNVGAGYVIGQSDFDFAGAPYTPPPSSAADFDFRPEVREIEIVVPTRPVLGGRDRLGWVTNAPADIRYIHPWDTKPRKGTDVEFDYDQEPPLPDKPKPEKPEIKEAYLFMNSSSLKKLPEGIPLDFEDLSITLDIDSFSWALSVRILNPESMAQIKPGPAGPVEVEATVNNKVWRFMVERYALERKFPSETYRVSGSSVTQLLAAPYSPRRSAQIETPTNAQQVIQDILDLTGFSVVWDPSLADYTIPAGAWGYENRTPIEVIDELVKAAGGIVVPTMNLSELRAYHRYREGAPWYWDQIDASRLDFQIADSTILGLSSQWEPNPAYNGVYVSGISAGVAVDVVRQGTAGDIRAPDDYHALNVSTQQCRGKAVSILGQSGDQEIVTIEIPLPTSGAPGLVTPGQWGEVVDTRETANSWRGLVLSTRVSVSQPGAADAIQIVKLERHHY